MVPSSVLLSCDNLQVKLNCVRTLHVVKESLLLFISLDGDRRLLFYLGMIKAYGL